MDSSIENRFLMSQWTSIPWYGFYRNRGFKNSITHLNLGDEWNGLRWGWPSRKQHVSRAPRHHTSQVRNDTIFSICWGQFQDSVETSRSWEISRYSTMQWIALMRFVRKRNYPLASLFTTFYERYLLSMAAFTSVLYIRSTKDAEAA